MTSAHLERSTLDLPRDPEPGRCDAIVSEKWISGGWRCSRRARQNGLCLQHARIPAHVPGRWLGPKRHDGDVVTVVPR